jgi:chromate transporter
MNPEPEEERKALAEVARVFLKLGVIGFGGPAAHVALMRREMVEKRRWVTEGRFLELFGASNLIPGPSSTELGMMLGYEHAGWSGLLVAGVCFITPAMLLVMTLAWAYVRFGSVPQTNWILYGVEPVIVAIIVDALWGLGRRALRSWTLGVLALAVLALYALGVDAAVLLFGGALLLMIVRNAARIRNAAASVFVPILPLIGAVRLGDASLTSVFLEFLKLGAVVFGSGYVLLAFLRADLVEHLHWLTERQLVDAIAIGQVTPGPVFTTATLVGYLVRGVPGALVATLGIFLPAFVLSGLVYALLPRLQRSPWANAFIEGVTVCALAIMAGVTVQLGHTVLVDWFTVALAIGAFVVLRRYQPNSAWLVLAGAVAGLAGRGLGLV